MERSPRSSPRADRSEAPPDPFGAPAVPVEPGAAPTELIGFVVQRLLRVGSAALVMVVLGEFVRPAGGALQALFLVAFAVGVWTPTSAVLFRVRFLRSPHEDEHDPGPRATVVRALTAEHVVGSVPLLVAAGFAMRFLGPTGLAVGLLAVAIVGRKLWQSVVTMERHLAALERVDERFDAAALRLRRLERWTVGRGRDAARSDLAQTLQLTGRIDDAVAALERISDPVGHRVPAKLARLVVAADPGRALAVAEAAALSGPDRLVVEVLAALHSEGKLDRNLFSVCLLPTGGHLSIGDVNTTGHLSPMKFVKFTSTT